MPPPNQRPLEERYLATTTRYKHDTDIHDLPNCVKHSSTRMYADDTNLTASGSNTEEIKTMLEKDSESVVEWALC